GRRTITTANAYQKMVKPGNGGLSCWNSFIRVYKNDLSAPLYSSLIVGQWDTLTQQGGGNTELFGIFKTEGGVVGVGRQQADGSGVPLGNDIPVTQVPSWGQSTPAGEAAILVFYPAGNLVNPLDNPGVTTGVADALSKSAFVYPNPTTGMVSISGVWAAQSITLMDHTGRLLGSCNWSETGNGLRVTLPEVVEGAYLLSVKSASGEHRFPFIIK
ncbi:MAG: T9SS type A sorting domain-containing protein, partial [Bacteroidia bacterium]|nr:T9SS type A sorting domain-containing protein [Bacteroidia bacterium]